LTLKAFQQVVCPSWPT